MKRDRSPLLTHLRADTIRQFGTYRFALLIKAFFSNPCFRPLVTLRLCQSVKVSRSFSWLLLPLLKIFHHLGKKSAGIDLPWRTKVGSGLHIAHGFGLVINPNAVIGNNVTLFHGVTLGRRDRIAPDGTRTTSYPFLEDDVWCGPHAVIVGVRIGQGSRIAGGAFVTQDIPPHSLVIGNPAQIVKTGVPPDVINRAPISDNEPTPEATRQI